MASCFFIKLFYPPNRRKNNGSTDAYGADPVAPQAEIGGRRKGMPCIGAWRGGRVAAGWRDCARPQGGLRIPLPTAFVLGKVLKNRGARQSLGPLVFMCDSAYESELSTHRRT